MTARSCIAALSLLLLTSGANAQDSYPAATVIAEWQTCNEVHCPTHDAVVFVHGIYGGDDTFRSASFDWPKNIPHEIGGRKIDVFRIKYETALLTWLNRNIATMDDVVYSIFKSLYPDKNQPPAKPLDPRRYRSVNFIGHSLGGNIITAFVHTVKSELGHAERARYGFIVTLSTPVEGAILANFVLLVKEKLGGAEPLLESLKKDNTFVRMLAHWQRSEDVKARRFDCRLVMLYAGVEGKPVFGIPGMTVVSREEALGTLRKFNSADASVFKYFESYDHMSIAKPINANPGETPYRWVNTIMEKEFVRLERWKKPLCQNITGIMADGTPALNGPSRER